MLVLLNFKLKTTGQLTLNHDFEATQKDMPCGYVSFPEPAGPVLPPASVFITSYRYLLEQKHLRHNAFLLPHVTFRKVSHQKHQANIYNTQTTLFHRKLFIFFCFKLYDPSNAFFHVLLCLTSESCSPKVLFKIHLKPAHQTISKVLN